MHQITFEFETPLPAGALDAATGFEIGWDFAHHALTPPAEHMLPGSPLAQGWNAGRATFGVRTIAPTRYTRKWLQLRLNAWRRGRVFEELQVTPNYLRQIDVARCPITREALTQATCTPSDASIDRVRNDAGYAAGNLAVMSARANTAKGDADFDAALARMRDAEAADGDAARAAPGANPDRDGLSAAQWARVAVLCSFVTELPHAQAAGLPLLVLPPNRLRMFNPVQALQALVTRQFELPGWRTRVARLVALVPGKRARRDFHVFTTALLPRLIEARAQGDADATRWALEDAWRNPLVLRCWRRFALQLDREQAERIVLRASALHVGERIAVATNFEQATEGWGLAQRGYVAAGGAATAAPRRVRRAPGRPNAPLGNVPARGEAAPVPALIQVPFGAAASAARAAACA